MPEIIRRFAQLGDVGSTGHVAELLGRSNAGSPREAALSADGLEQRFEKKSYLVITMIMPLPTLWLLLNGNWAR